jgi:succinate dehydrogenase/fumarate reductase cytochrome b subunit
MKFIKGLVGIIFMAFAFLNYIVAAQELKSYLAFLNGSKAPHPQIEKVITIALVATIAFGIGAIFIRYSIKSKKIQIENNPDTSL